MKCKICGASCEEMSSGYTKYCVTYAPVNSKIGHYSIFYDAIGFMEVFKYGKFEIQTHYRGNTCTSISVYLSNKLTGKMTQLEISKNTFDRMNFDPKNPQKVLNKLETLKCFC